MRLKYEVNLFQFNQKMKVFFFGFQHLKFFKIEFTLEPLKIADNLAYQIKFLAIQVPEFW